MIGPTTAGLLFDITGSYTIMWVSLGITIIFAIRFMLNIGAKEKRGAPTEH